MCFKGQPYSVLVQGNKLWEYINACRRKSRCECKQTKHANISAEAECAAKGGAFWHYLPWYILKHWIINSYIIYTQSLTHPLIHEQHMMTHLKYRLKIVKQLIAGFSSRKRAGRRAMNAPVMQPSGMIGHDLVKMSKKLVCRNCSQQSRKTQQGRGLRPPGNVRHVTFLCAGMAVSARLTDLWC